MDFNKINYCEYKGIFTETLKGLRRKGYIGLNIFLSDINDEQWEQYKEKTVLIIHEETKTVELMSELDLMDYANDDEEKELDERLEEIEDDGTEAAETDVRVEFARSSYAPGGVIPNDDGKQRKEFIEGKIKILKESLMEYEQELKELTQLYYLKVTDSPFDYLSLDLIDETWEVSVKEEVNGYQTQFAKEEIMDINPKLWGIAVPVEEDDRRC